MVDQYTSRTNGFIFYSITIWWLLTLHNTSGVKERLQKKLGSLWIAQSPQHNWSVVMHCSQNEKAGSRRTNKKVRQEVKLRIVRDERKKGGWRRRNSEKSSLQSVKGQQPTLWFHLASALSTYVCVFQRVEERQSDKWPCICVFVYVSTRLHMCVFEYTPAHLWLLVLCAYILCVCDVFLWQCSEDERQKSLII